MPQKPLDMLQQSHDFVLDALDNGNFRIEVLYVNTLCDPDLIKKEIAHPFLLSASPEAFEQVLTSALTGVKLKDDEDPTTALLGGHSVVRLQGAAYKIKTPKKANDKVTEAIAETTLQGPQTALSEDVDTNLMLLRRRYPLPTMIAEQYKLGKLSQTNAYLVYDKEKANPRIVEEFKKRLDSIEADVIFASGQVEAIISKKKLRLFPVLLVTERADRVILNLSKGKIVLLVDGTPFTMIGPAVFYDFISAMDDIYMSSVVTHALVFLRYIGVFITTTLPALYVAISSYNPELIRVQFALSWAGSRAAVPYPSFIEVFLMLFLIEALIEASLRLPRFIGSTATTVGGLILGQAAQQAGLVSSVMIIVTSAVAISNFLIPINAMSFAFRVVKYPLIVLAAAFGLVGVVAGLFAVTIYIVNLDSFGMTYFRIFLGETAASGYKEGDPY